MGEAMVSIDLLPECIGLQLFRLVRSWNRQEFSGLLGLYYLRRLMDSMAIASTVLLLRRLSSVLWCNGTLTRLSGGMGFILSSAALMALLLISTDICS